MVSRQTNFGEGSEPAPDDQIMAANCNQRGAAQSNVSPLGFRPSKWRGADNSNLTKILSLNSR